MKQVILALITLSVVGCKQGSQDAAQVEAKQTVSAPVKEEPLKDPDLQHSFENAIPVLITRDICLAIKNWKHGDEDFSVFVSAIKEDELTTQDAIVNGRHFYEFTNGEIWEHTIDSVDRLSTVKIEKTYMKDGRERATILSIFSGSTRHKYECFMQLADDSGGPAEFQWGDFGPESTIGNYEDL